MNKEIHMRASFGCAAALLLTTVGLAANAQDTLLVTFVNDGQENVTIKGSAVLGGTGNTSAIPLFGTLFDASNNKIGGPFTVYCVDLADDQSSGVTQGVAVSSITPSTTAGTLLPPVSGQQLSEASYLINTYGAAANAASMTGAPSSYDTLQAALQLAIWGVISGDTLAGLDISKQTAGDAEFYLSSYEDQTAVNDANAELAALNTAIIGGGGLGYGTLYADTDASNHPPTGQNLLGDATPEGSTMAMFALGLAPLFGFKWLAARRRTVS
jgi:hypothetical protein